MILTILVVFGLVLGLIVLTIVPDNARAQFYKGKTITMIVNYPAGGPTDLEGRIVALHLPAHIPGNPTIVVKNVGGAGGLIGSNQLGESTPNGESIGFFTLDVPGQLVGASALRTPYSDFVLVAGVESPLVVYIRKDTPPGINVAADLMKAREFKALSLNAQNTNTLNQALALDLLGVPNHAIPAYRGLKEVETAILQNEVLLVERIDPRGERLDRLARRTPAGAVDGHAFDTGDVRRRYPSSFLQPIGVLPQPQRQLVDGAICGGGLVVADKAGDPSVERRKDPAARILRRAVEPVAQIAEQRIAAIGCKLLRPLGVGACSFVDAGFRHGGEVARGCKLACIAHVGTKPWPDHRDMRAELVVTPARLRLQHRTLGVAARQVGLGVMHRRLCIGQAGVVA